MTPPVAMMTTTPIPPPQVAMWERPEVRARPAARTDRDDGRRIDDAV
jgi:hypothetical protein